VEGVADGSEVMRTTIAYLAYNRGARVNTDSDAQRGLQLAREFAAEFFDPADHSATGEERLPTGGLKVGVGSEQCHHAIASVLVRYATRFSYGTADRFEVAVEEEYDVIGQLVFGDLSEAAYVREQHGDFAFPPAKGVGWSATSADTPDYWEEWCNYYIATRS